MLFAPRVQAPALCLNFTVNVCEKRWRHFASVGVIFAAQ